MKTLITLLLLFILFTMSTPLALAVFFFLLIGWVILLPFKILGFTLAVIFKTVAAILLLPFKLLGL